MVAKQKEPSKQSHRIVVKNLKRHVKENNDPRSTVSSVQSLLRDGLKLAKINVTSAVRKDDRDGKPGLIVADIETIEQKHQILKSKKLLKGNKKYPDVYIDNDLPIEVRQTEASLRTLVKEMGKEKKYFVRGTRLIKNTRT